MAAEKLEAVVSLGVVNSRYKDLYDLYSLLVEGGLPDDRVVQASKNTFKHRGTAIPETPESLSVGHWQSDAFTIEWSRFLKRIGTDFPSVSDLQETLLPRLRAIYTDVRNEMLGE